MTSDTELVERLRGWHEDALCVQAASAIERLCAERDEAREGGTPEAKRLLAQIDALTKRAEEAEREVERLASLAVAYDYLESPARADLAEAALSTANAEVERLREAPATSNRHLDFVARWAWREGAHLTDAERLSVIKYYPPIKALADLSARSALQAEAKP